MPIVLSALNPSQVASATQFEVLVGSYDGVIGWAALVWFAVIAVTFAVLSRRRAA